METYIWKSLEQGIEKSIDKSIDKILLKKTFL